MSVAEANILQDLRDRIRLRREEARALHAGGAPGSQVAAALTDIVDEVVGTLYRCALERLAPRTAADADANLTLVAVGGYGRGDLSPNSDVDLMILYRSIESDPVRAVSSYVLQSLWDVGLQVGHSVRTIAQAVELAREDLTVRTTQFETRLLAGDPGLLEEFRAVFENRVVGRDLNAFLDAVLREREKEYQEYYAPTVLLLEPNVKKSRGGLRDLHVLRWVGRARHACRGLDALHLAGHLGADDARALDEAREFLLRVRHEMHFHAGREQDVLDLDEQVRIAEAFGFEKQGGLLGVERFMHQYYRLTTAVHDLTRRFVERARRTGSLDGLTRRFRTRRVEGDFLAGPAEVAIAPDRVADVLQDGERVLRLFELARERRLPVAWEARERVRAAGASGWPRITPAVRRRFFAAFARPEGLGAYLRALREVGLLGRLVPAFEKVRCLIQFNKYHKFTVDEHALLAVEAVCARASHPGLLGRVYAEIKRKDLLHLATLLHDLGKGQEEDHSLVGRRIAEQTAADFGLEGHDRDVLAFLVHQHLLMAHIAFRRDLSDPDTVLKFARDVATPEVLQKLYVFTAADTDAVGPGTWTSWKESLLDELYARAMEQLTGQAPTLSEAERIAERERAVRGALAGAVPEDWLAGQLAALPSAYLLGTPAGQIARHLRILRETPPGEVRVTSHFESGNGITEYTVFTVDSIAPGLFSRIAGALAACGMEIVGAQIHTGRDGRVIDAFQVVDPDYRAAPPPERRARVAGAIRDVLTGARDAEALFAQGMRFTSGSEARAGRHAAPTQVETDVETSDRATIVEVFTEDRRGLLYILTRTMFELGLSVTAARISTRLDQVADVFYVTDRAGAKIADEARLAEIRARLLAAIEAHLKSSQTAA